MKFVGLYPGAAVAFVGLTTEGLKLATSVVHFRQLTSEMTPQVAQFAFNKRRVRRRLLDSPGVCTLDFARRTRLSARGQILGWVRTRCAASSQLEAPTASIGFAPTHLLGLTGFHPSHRFVKANFAAIRLLLEKHFLVR